MSEPLPIRCTRCGGTYVEAARAMGKPVEPYCRGCGRQDTGRRVNR